MLGVVELRQEADLAGESCSVVRALKWTLVHHLDGDVPAGALLKGAVDDPLPPAMNLGLKRVSGNGVSRQLGGGGCLVVDGRLELCLFDAAKIMKLAAEFGHEVRVIADQGFVPQELPTRAAKNDPLNDPRSKVRSVWIVFQICLAHHLAKLRAHAEHHVPTFQT